MLLWLARARVSDGKQRWDLKEGEYYDLPDPVAQKAIEGKIVRKAEDIRIEEAKPSSPAAKAKGVDVQDYIDKARSEGGVWIRTAELSEGDELEVIGPGEVDSETFDRPYLTLPVMYKGNEKRLRIGSQNAERISRKLGKNSAQWVGHKIRVLALEPCPGLTKSRGVVTKRAILDGV